MTNSQRLQVRAAEIRARLATISGMENDAITDEITGECRALQKELATTETKYAAALASEQAEEREEPTGSPEQRERQGIIERCSIGELVEFRMGNRALPKEWGELQDGLKANLIPLDYFEPRAAEAPAAEHRADAATTVPGTVGINLQPVVPGIFKRTLAARLGIEMPSVGSGTFGVPRISANLTAGTPAAAAQEATAATVEVTTAAPKPIRARLAVSDTDIAKFGNETFDPALRANLADVLADKYDDELISGSNTNGRLKGLLKNLANVNNEADTDTFDTVLAKALGGVDGTWAEMLREIMLVVGTASYVKFGGFFRDVTAQYLGSISLTDYLAEHTAGLIGSARMPAAAVNVQGALLARTGMAGRARAIAPNWGHVAIGDIYSGSAQGLLYLTLSMQAGDVVLPNGEGPYKKLSFKLA